VVKASNRGVSAARNASGEPNWSFGQSLFFSSTVVTTIGNDYALWQKLQNCKLQANSYTKNAFMSFPFMLM
jgi:hypothetical protein